MNKAVFLDRDGTINEEMGYINHLSRFVLLPGVAEGIRKLKENGFLTIVVTNQAGVARGYFSEDLLKKVHEKMQKLLKQQKAELDAIYYCPHHPEVGPPEYKIDCNCRKPKPGMIEKAVRDYSIDLKKSYMIGDRYTDIKFAKQFDMKAIMVLTGYGRGEFEYFRHNWTIFPDFIAEDFLEAVNWILKYEKLKNRKLQ